MAALSVHIGSWCLGRACALVGVDCVGVGGPVLDGNVGILAVGACAAGALAVGLDACAEARTHTLGRFGVACAAKGGVHAGCVARLLGRWLRCGTILWHRL